MPKIVDSKKALNKQQNFRLSGELKEKIGEVCAKYGISEGVLIRRAISEYIKKHTLAMCTRATNK